MESALFQPILLWVQANPNLAGFAVFTISFLESLVGPGFFIPGVFFMSSIGALVGAGVLALWPTLTYAVLGAVAGDYASFWIGWRYKNKVRQWWFFKKYPRLLARGYAFFRKHGGKSIIFGRFVGPVRPIIPVIAGMMRMPPKYFLLTNVISALLWAPFYSSPGYFLGASLNDFSLEIAARICAYLLAFVLMIWVLHFGHKRTISSLIKLVRKILKAEWLVLKHLPYGNRLTTLLKDQRFSHHRGQVLQFNFMILSFLLFGLCLFSLLSHTGLFYLNNALYHFARAAHVLKADLFFTMVTKFGEIAFLQYPLILIALYLFFKRKWAVIVHGSGLLFIAYLSAKALKMWVHYPRPNGIVATLHDYSFPSGHTVLSTSILGFLAFIIARNLRPRFRFLPIFIWLVAVLLVMMSRLYLGAHWALDVLSGFFLSCFLLLLINMHYQNSCRERLPVHKCVTLFIIGILFGYIMQIANNHLVDDYRGYQLVHRETATSLQAWKNNELTQAQFRTDVFGHAEDVFNLQILDEPQHLKALLNAHGWTLRPKFKLSHTAQWFSAHPNAEHVPAFPLFHQDKLPEINLIKIRPDCVYAITLWASGYTIEGKPLLVGRVSQLKRSHPLPLVTIYEGELLDPTKVALDTLLNTTGFETQTENVVTPSTASYILLKVKRAPMVPEEEIEDLWEE